ncbi:hypothetical protein LY90DRAFT_677520 [Neocallimastix californiae]|uniref:Mediator complex subunit 15 KIX domain-containing protein n=1 Tax=Neocallimastix californiae TaxID=1754190 RepID=A0A1Y1ZZ44_9FUNG|nr:hypothetical protein LY90DRAFT_677520 [Neocallimastix californiae]|eukprot:ORY15522.1 hypothetical protein LY90DRAFT_677520 [Neocallimastix californiae]
MSYSKSKMIQNPELFRFQIQNQQNSQLLNLQQRQQQLQQQILLQQQQQQGQFPQLFPQLNLRQFPQQLPQQFQIQQQKRLPMQQHSFDPTIKINPATMQFTSPIGLPANSIVNNDTIQRLQQLQKQKLTQPALMQYQQQQAQTVAAMAMNNSFLLKKQMETPEFENYRKLVVNEIAKKFIKIIDQIDNKKAVELAQNVENQIFKNSSSKKREKKEMYTKLLAQQLQLITLKNQKVKEQQKQQQQSATMTTQHKTPLQFPTTVITDKVNGNPVLLQTNNTISPTVAAISKTINNTSSSMNVSKLASQSPSLQTIPKITQPVAVNNIVTKTLSPNNIAQNLQFQQNNQNIAFQQQKQAILQNQLQSTILAQKNGIIKQQQQQQLGIINEQKQKLIAKIEEKYNLLLRSVDIIKKQKNKISEQKSLNTVTTTTASNIVQVQTQVKNQFPIKTTLNQTTQFTTPSAVTSLNNLNQSKVDTVNKTSINQSKINKFETITENHKNKGLKSTSSKTHKEEIEKSSNKISNSSSTKKRNRKKSTTASSSLIPLSRNLNSKKAELSTALEELSSKKSTDLSKDIREEKENSSFLRGIDRNINIFLLDKKDFKNHIKSNPKTKNIIQNSFKYIIDSNSTAFGINSCAEDLSSLCFNNKDNYNDKPIKLENISDSPNDHVSLFEDIINRKSHIIPIVNTFNKKDSNQLSNETNNDNDIKTNNKRKIDSINDDLDTSSNINKKIKTDDKYSNIIEEINYLKDQYKVKVNVIDLGNTASIIKNNNKSCEIPWNEFVTMINNIYKEERELDAQTYDPSSSHINNMRKADGEIPSSATAAAVSPKAASNLSTEKNNNKERALLIITLNLSNYIDINEVETEYNIPGDNQSNIIVYARIPKSTQQYHQQGILDWNLSYLKKKSIFQTSDEDNKLKEKNIYKFISQKINDYQTNTNINTNTLSSQPIIINNTTMTNLNKNSNTTNNNFSVKVYHIIEWILECIKN